MSPLPASSRLRAPVESVEAPTAAPARRAPFDWNRVLRIALPALVFAASLWWWEHYVETRQIPPYVLPSPSLIGTTLLKDWQPTGLCR